MALTNHFKKIIHFLSLIKLHLWWMLQYLYYFDSNHKPPLAGLRDLRGHVATVGFDVLGSADQEVTATFASHRCGR